MKNILILILKLFGLWLAIFFFNRLAFILFFTEKFSGVSFSEIASSFYHALPLDFSATCYLLVFPVLIILVHSLFPKNFFTVFLKFYLVIMIIVNALVNSFDLGIYDAWDTKLNMRAIDFMKYSGDATAFTSIGSIVLLVVVFLIQAAVGIVLLLRVFKIKLKSEKRNYAGALVSVVMTPILFLGIRGGWQLIPINESDVYFSTNDAVNAASVNTLWYAGNKIYQSKSALKTNPYQFMNNDEAKRLVNELYDVKQDSITHVLSTDRPNIVLFILESFTADVVEALGGLKGVTPNLDSLIHNGLLFTNVYAQGTRTDQGLADVMSAFPAQPNFSVVMQSEKYPHLSFLPKQLMHAGYSTSFYYGGELGFANMRAYLLTSGMSDLHGKEIFSDDEMNAKWGAHDGFVFQKQANDASQFQQPFFSGILSLSSHEPFTVPMTTKFEGEDRVSKFLNSCAYTDQCLGDYFRSLKQQPWYTNTLFILVADHGHYFATDRNPIEPGRFHIPLLFFGEVIKPEYRGTTIDRLGMQIDLVSTMLAQLSLPTKDFRWSNNLLNPNRNDFAYYTYDSGFGWITDNGWMRKNFSDAQPLVNGLSGEEVKTGNAFLQELFEEYVGW